MQSKRIYVLGCGYAAVVLAFTGYVMLDAFVIERAYATVSEVTQAQQETAIAQGTTDASASETSVESGALVDSGNATTSERTGRGPGGGHHGSQGGPGGHGGPGGSTSSSTHTQEEISTATTSDETSTEVNASTKLSTMRYLDTTVYVVDLYCDGTSLMTALANDVYGKNVTQTTSSMASAKGATVAINGDYYGSRNEGYVVRNGVLYRDTSAGSDQQDLVIYRDGTTKIVCEGDVTAQELVDAGAWQVFSFGPGLVSGGSVSVGLNDEVDQATNSNPRTAIGQVGEGHYVFVVADGRTSESSGLSLYELATFMKEQLGVQTAYNLDGGGSSTLYVNGSIVNNPTGGGFGSSGGERKVSDIVYVSL